MGSKVIDVPCLKIPSYYQLCFIIIIILNIIVRGAVGCGEN